MKLRVNPEECARAVRLLHPNDDELFEIRLIGKNPHYAASGIFRTAETAVNALCNYKAGYKKDAAAEAASIYISLNPPVRECYSLAQHDKFVEGALTVNDNDIDCLNWLFIDLDPERRTGISASEEELERAENKAREVYVYLDKMGFSEPVAAMSGNGYHLMYRLDCLENCEENVQMLEDTLKAISERFSGGGVKIDAVNFNPSRICKLWGSLAQKGSDTRERPHRMSYIKHIPEKGVRATPAELLFKVIEDCADAADKDSNVSAGHKPKKETARRKAGFDLDKWLAEHDLSVMGRKEKNGDTIYPLKHCVFDPSHTDNDAAIIKKADGTVCYHCFHNSCRDKGWRDVRQLFEPDAYKSKYKDKPVQNTFSADTQNDEPKTILLTVDSFTKFCEEYGFFFKWDAIKNEMIYGGFDKGENPVTLPNTAPTILQGILKPLGYKAHQTHELQFDNK